MDGSTANNVVGDAGNDVVSGGVVDGVGGNVAGASDGGKKRLGNGPLIAILVVLLVVIVGLGVGIFLNTRGKTAAEISAACDGVEVAELNKCLYDEIQGGDGGEDNDNDNDNSGNKVSDNVIVETYLDSAAKMVDEGENDSAARLIISGATTLAVDDQCDVALEILKGTDVSEFDNNLKGWFYSYALSLTKSCGNEGMTTEYSNLLTQVNSEIDDLEGGF